MKFLADFYIGNVREGKYYGEVKSNSSLQWNKDMEEENMNKEVSSVSADNTKKEFRSETQKYRHFGMWVSIISLALVVVIAASIWEGWGKLEIIFQQQLAQIQQLQMKESSLSQQLEEANRLITQQSLAMSNNEAAIVHLLKLTGNTQDNWVLAEAEYLIRLANLNLHFERNVPVVIALLKAADAHLRSFGDTQFLNMRKVLAQDIVKLEAVPTVDREGIYLRLQALDNRVEHLPLIQSDLKFTYDQKKSGETIDHPSMVKKVIFNSWDAIKQVLIIRHREQPIAPLLSLKERSLLDLNLHILFSQAEWAVLQRQQSIYIGCLQQIQQQIQTYFLQTDYQTQQLENALKDLQQQTIDPNIPDISDSLQVIRALHQFQIHTSMNREAAQSDQDIINKDVKNLKESNQKNNEAVLKTAPIKKEGAAA